MVKKSKKSLSKRLTLKKKYKILRKVKEHHKKKAKEAKKAEKRKPRAEKDPGIPNQWPFREQELKVLEMRRQRAIEDLEKKKQAKKEARAEKRKLEKGGAEDSMDVEGGGDGKELADLAAKAKLKSAEFERRKRVKKEDLGLASLNDGSRRAFYKEFVKVIEAADVVIEVLDARDPLGCRCKEVERLVLKGGPNKRVVLLLNKIDLVPREVAEKWLKYFREELPTVAFKCSTQLQKSHLGQKSLRPGMTDGDLLNTSESLGADTLLQLLKNYSRNQKLKTSVTVGVVGMPNVGKSSLINSLKRSRVANVGSMPGVTRSMQEIHLDKHVKLLDCPGVVFASAIGNESAAALRNCVKVESLQDPITPVREILRLCQKDKLMSIYRIGRFKDADEFLRSVAFSRGKLKKGGVVDVNATAMLVLKEWNEGKIPYYTLPPKREGAEPLETKLVTEWGKEFDVDEVFKNEESAVISGLRSLTDDTFAELPPGEPVTMEMGEMDEDGDNDMEEEEEEEAEEEEEEDGDDDDEEDGNEDEEGADGGDEKVEEMDDQETVAPQPPVARGQAYLHQTEKLYDVEGMFNPHKARADKKRRKKEVKVQASSMPQGEGRGEESKKREKKPEKKGSAKKDKKGSVNKDKKGSVKKDKKDESMEADDGSDYDFAKDYS